MIVRKMIDMFANEGEHFETSDPGASTAKTATPTLDFDNSPSYSGVNYNPPKERVVIKEVEKPQRQITEIRIFFDDRLGKPLFLRSKR